VAREVDVEKKSAELFQESAQNALRLALESGRNQELAYTATSIRTGIKRLSRMKYTWTGLSSVNVDEVFRKSVDPGIASEVALRDATAGIILYRLGKELRDYKWTRAFWRRVIATGLELRDPLAPRKLREHHGETILNLLELTKESGDIWLFGYIESDFFIERVFHPRYLLELIERNPETALTWVQLAKEVGGNRISRRVDPELLEVVLSRSNLTKLLYRNPTAFATALWLVRISDSTRITGEFLRLLSGVFQRWGQFSTVAARLPISTLPDLEWLVQQADDTELAEPLHEWLQRIVHGGRE